MILIIASLFSLVCSALPVYGGGVYDSSLAPRDAEYFTLRVMPLGASITQGYLSSDNNGYRKVLREQLRYSGWPVNTVGSLADGTMLDNNHEGHGGYRIDQVTAVVENNISEMPNLILLNVGTNDALQNYDTDNAGERLDSLLTFLYGAISNTTIIMSTLLPNTVEPDLVSNINEQYHDVYDNREAAGDRIVLADMYTFLTTDDLQDGTHPTDYGYEKMASVWWAAIQTALGNNYLSAPIDTGVSDFPNNTCEQTYASSNTDNYAQTQEETGTDDGNYIHTSQDMGRLLDIATVAGDIYQGINLAQLVNVYGGYRENALDELVWTRDGDGTYMFLNENSGVFGSSVELDVKIPCLAKGVHWGDVNNDGLDDFICIGADGAMYVAINQGATDNVPTFEDIGQVMAAPGNNMTQTNVRLGDIDGDGRIDYCLIANNGDIQCWRNGGQGYAPTSTYGGYWQDLGIVFTGKGLGDIAGVRFVDINGDFRSDWLWLDDTGKVTTYINNRGTGKGSLAPDWVSAGVTHAGMGVAGARDRVKFGNVYAGNGADYLYVETVESASNASVSDNYAHVWKNTGYGGTTLKGDGDYYCDMRGTDMDDYVWISPDGVGYLYGNTLNPPNWDPAGLEIFDTATERKALHLADFDGDGKCDLLLVDRATGAAEVWINNWDSSSMNWDKRGVVTGDATCTQAWGVGLYDIGLRFYDVNGDHRADYLCMEPDGRTTGTLNLGENDFQDIGQIKHSEGYDRANHQWADVNGDGLVDFLWVDKFSGDTLVWQNAGQMPNGTLIDGSSFQWTPLGTRYEGEDRGANIHFPNLGGLGRADYQQVIPRTNVAYTWYNVCPGGGISALDDESASIDPELPAYTGS
ncbi:hypothetical protein TCE0_015r02825 [Talaromyces pinophilus]|uniref:Uncharacterized protein n=1 Tax=Talaromyces pinophilus TaxID=128442 RepID=A0A6V8H1R8_TALPI|nr:hypothetical protein TCE0_015r02825 [Talaromyces pinophilus]